MRHPDVRASTRARARRRSVEVWAQGLFGVALLVPCLLAARPTPRSAASPRDTSSVDAPTTDTPCTAAPLARPRLVIHVQACRFELFDACGCRLRQGPCSTGNDAVLQAADGRRWTFRTPRGRRRVHHKAPRPVWYKPDWAFIEANEPIPPRDSELRYARGMLGGFALDIGNGYLVHGSPYRIGIGTRTTHGCIRLLAEDLEVVYETLQIGDEVVLK